MEEFDMLHDLKLQTKIPDIKHRILDIGS